MRCARARSESGERLPARDASEALAAFSRDSGFYPRTLKELSPTYLDVNALAIPKQMQVAYPLEYSRADSSYRLTFRYVGPGMNECTFRPLTRLVCSGHF